MKDLKQKFLKWYKLTHWMYDNNWLLFDDNRFLHPETQTMYLAYRAGFNRAIKETKHANTSNVLTTN